MRGGTPMSALALRAKFRLSDHGEWEPQAMGEKLKTMDTMCVERGGQ
jgi:hypothetical protein